MAVVNLIDPLNPWSLWVPLTLLMFIVMIAVWFVRLSQR